MWLADLGLWRGKRERLYRESKKEAKKLIDDRRTEMRRDGERVFNLSHQEIARLEAADQRAKAAGFRDVNECVDVAIAAGKPIQHMRLADAITECIASKESTGKRKTYIRKFKSHLNGFKINLEDFRCHQITREQVESWAWAGEEKNDKPTKVKPISARSRIIDIGTFFSFCIKRRWCLRNPVDDIEPILLEDKPPGIHTVEQAEQLLKSCLSHKDGQKVICYVALGYFGGLRPFEALRLKPEDIDLKSKLINVEGDKAKTRRRRLIPINETLEAWLNISTIPRQKNFHRDFDRVKAGIPWPHDVLRHTFCSYALPKYGATKTAEWAGHSEQILFAHYRERVKPTDASRFWSLHPLKFCEIGGNNSGHAQAVGLSSPHG